MLGFQRYDSPNPEISGLKKRPKSRDFVIRDYVLIYNATEAVLIKADNVVDDR